MPQLRQNIVTGEWVIIAPERSKRPSDFIAAETIKTDTKINCPFCLTGASYQKERLINYENDHVYAFPNKFPAFVEDPKHCSNRSRLLEDGFYNVRPSTGGHDVLAVKDHETNLFDFTLPIWRDLFGMARRRYQYWRKDCNTEYSMMIYNQGVKAGASIHHPHAQIMASNIIPNHISKELLGAEAYFSNSGGCVFCDLLAHELAQKTRVIEENAHFVAFTFYAARFPFEVWVLPKNHRAHFEDEPDELIESLAVMMKKVIGRLGGILHKPPLNFFVHDLPTSVEQADYYHWHIEIAPRVSTYGGFELGSGTIIDIIAPEDAAEFLRESHQRSAGV